MRDVIIDFPVCELLERYLSCNREMALPVFGSETYTRYYMMSFPAQHPEHTDGIVGCFRFTQNDTLSFLVVLLISGWCDDYGISRENQAFLCRRLFFI